MFIIEYKTMVANTVYFEFLSFFIQTFICNTQLNFENYNIKLYLEEESENFETQVNGKNTCCFFVLLKIYKKSMFLFSLYFPDLNCN